MAQMTIEELATQTNTSPRTIRYYISEGMLPSPGTRGRTASYGDDHLARLQLIRALLDRHLPLAEIKRQLEMLSHDDVVAVLHEEQARQTALDRAAETASPKRYISELLRQTHAQETHARYTVEREPSPNGPLTRRQTDTLAPAPPAPQFTVARTESSHLPPPSIWQRIELAPDLEIHVRAASVERLRPLLDALIALARDAARQAE